MIEFKLNENNRNVSDEELIKDLQLVAQKLGLKQVTRETYNKYGRFSYATLSKRFSGWENALSLAGLNKNRNYNLSDEDLFRNMEKIWISLGRQPKRDELSKNSGLQSEICGRTYEMRFGNWRKALEAFILYINSEPPNENTEKTFTEYLNTQNQNKPIHKTKREISDRLRFSILVRDGFTCKKCGRSNIKTPGQVDLQVDHIIPWSKGGETISENLETKCKECNLGKGSEFNV